MIEIIDRTAAPFVERLTNIFTNVEDHSSVTEYKMQVSFKMTKKLDGVKWLNVFLTSGSTLYADVKLKKKQITYELYCELCDVISTYHLNDTVFQINLSEDEFDKLVEDAGKLNSWRWEKVTLDSNTRLPQRG